MTNFEILQNKLDNYNTLSAEEKTIELDAMRGLVKAINAERLDNHCATLLSAATPADIFRAYIAEQTYTIMRLVADENGNPAIADGERRLTFKQLESHATVKIAPRGDWYRMLEAYCDNIAISRAQGTDGNIRMTRKMETFTTPAEMTDYKAKNGLAIGNGKYSKTVLCEQLNALFAAVIPDGVTNADGKPFTAYKSDYNHFVDCFVQGNDKKGQIGARLSNAARMEKTLFACILTRMNNMQYVDIQGKTAAAKKSPTEKEIAKENAGAPDTTTTPPATAPTVTTAA